MDAEDRRAEWAEVAAAERAALSRAGEPVTDTAGLALSGGGVRSATFALGVLDELKRAGLLKKLHYLSTVSGGSHIGAWLVVNCARAAARNDDWLKPDADWSASIRRLRSAAAATSRSDWWSTIAASLFTTVIATVTVILSMASVLLIAPIAFSGFLAWPNAGHWRWLMVLLPVQAVVISAASQLSSASPNAGVEGRAWRPATIAAVTGVAIAWAVGLTTEFDPFPSDQLDYRAAFPIAALILLAGFLSVPAASRLVATIGSRWPASREPAATINLTSSWVQAIVILPLMVTAYLITATLWSSNRPEYYEFSGVVSTAWRSPSFPVVVFVASLWLIASCSVRRRGPRSALAVATAGALTTGVLYIVLCVIILWLNYARATGPWGPLHAVVWGPPFVAFGFALAVMFLIGIIGREAPSGVRDWWYRMSTWLALYAVGWLVIGAAAVYVPSLVSAWLNVNPWTAITVSIGAATTVAVGLAAARAHGLRERSPLKVWSENVALLAPAVYFAAMTVGVSALLNGLLGVYGEPAPVAADAASLPAFAEGPVIGVSAVMLTVCVTLTLLFATRFDVNEFSLNAAYRTRLVRRYLGATSPRG